jgi:hypothetical protein
MAASRLSKSRTGSKGPARRRIRKGIRDGDSVVVSGQFLIDSEANLKAAITRMSESPAPATNDTRAGTVGEHSGDDAPVTERDAMRSARPRAPSKRMIARLIRWSIDNRLLVLLCTLLLSGWGIVSLLRTPLDAFPTLSDVQVTIRTTFPGQAPQIVENQVTYPLATTMLSGAGREGGARILDVRRLVRLRPVRRRHRSRTGRARACSST